MNIPESPYKGLAPFEDSELDALLFFGRERDSEIVVANLLASRLTVLYGTSGVGKSSLLGASVARRLRQEPDAEVIVWSSWSGDAAVPLREALDSAATGCETYLILDQFEEYFLYHGDEAGEGTLADELPELLQSTDRRVNVLISVREDALASLDAFKARVPNVLANYLRLPHLDRAGGRAAITGPLARWSELAGEPERVEIEPELVEAVLDETAAGRLELGGASAAPVSSNGAEEVEAPILQLVMERLWQAERAEGSRVLRLATFRGIGGAETIVRRHLERAVGALTPADQDLAASVFDHLVTPSGSKIALRTADLAGYAGVSAVALEPVLATLARERILRSVEDTGSGGDRYEIFHDVLADPVLAWSGERRVERERRAAARRHRRLLALSIAAFVALAAVTAIAVFALVERDRARTHERQAAAREREANALRRSARARELEASALLGLPSGNDASLGLALRAARLEPDGRSEAVLGQALFESRLRQAFPASAPVASLQFGDARHLLVAGGSRVVRLEDLTGGRAKSFRDPAKVTAAALGPANLLLSGDANGDALLRNADSGAVLRPFHARGAVTAVAFSRDGRRMLVTTVGGATLVAGPRGSGVRSLPQPGPVLDGVLDPGGSLVATISRERSGAQRARVFDAGSGRLLEVLPQFGIRSVAFSLDGSLLATGSADGSIGLWRPRSGELVLVIHGGGGVNDVAFSPDGKLVASATADGVTRVYDAATGERSYLFSEHTSSVDLVAWSPDGRVLADASADRSANLYAIGTRAGKGSVVGVLPGNVDGTSALAFDPTGRRIATGGRGGGVRIWDARPEQLLVPLGFHSRAAGTVDYSPDGRLVVSAGNDGTARIWDVRSRKQVHVLPMPGRVADARFSPDGRIVVTAGTDGIARLWRVRDGKLLRKLGSGPTARFARFSPDGTAVAVAADDGTVTLWRVKDGAKLHAMHDGGPITALAFARNGKTVASAWGQTVDLWSVASGRLRRKLQPRNDVLAVAFSPDSRLLATAELRGLARLWDARSGRMLHVLRGHKARSRVTDVVFSPDGTLLLTTSSDNDGRTWEVPSGRRHQILRGQFGGLAGGAFSPSGRWIATAGPVTAVLWPADAGSPLSYLRGPTERLTDVEFSPNGRQIVTSSDDGGVRIYDCEVCGDLASLERLAEQRLRQSNRAVG